MKERDSRFELIRIIAILFIVIWHISIHAQKGDLESHDYITALCTTGVNIFILISGYFNIKICWKSFLTIIETIIFYHIISITLNWYIFKENPQVTDPLILLSPSTYSSWWFMGCYTLLMLLSPLINNLLYTNNERLYTYTIGILLFISCYSGFVFQNQINVTGYNIFNFITIYAVGDAIRKYDIPKRLSTKLWFILYLTATAFIFVASCIGIPRIAFYNNPLLIVAAVCLFCLVARCKINNKNINIIATYTLPLYLIQDSLFGQNVYEYLYDQGQSYNFTGVEYYCLLGKYLLGLFTGAIIADYTRRQILNRPTSIISKFLDKNLDIFH